MEFNPTAGAKSLIEDAIGACSNETLAIVAEDPNLGIYDAMVPECVAEVAGKLGIDTKIIHVGDHAGLENMPKVVSDALSNFDHVLFHSRLGDTLRFSNIPGQASKTMSYALDLSILGGPSCTVPHRVMEEIRTAYNRVADAAEIWRIRCTRHKAALRPECQGNRLRHALSRPLTTVRDRAGLRGACGGGRPAMAPSGAGAAGVRARMLRLLSLVLSLRCFPIPFFLVV